MAALAIRACPPPADGPQLLDLPANSLYAQVVALDERRGQATLKLTVLPRETKLVLEGPLETLKRLKESGAVVQFTIRDNQVVIGDARYKVARIVWVE